MPVQVSPRLFLRGVAMWTVSTFFAAPVVGYFSGDQVAITFS